LATSAQAISSTIITATNRISSRRSTVPTVSVRSGFTDPASLNPPSRNGTG
jgi:hypothetical protein